MALVNDKEDLENFIMDFFILDESVFETLRDWHNFFCDGQDLEYMAGYGPEITELVGDISPERFPESYPALVMFDFEDFTALYMQADEALFEAIPVEKLDIKNITTRDGAYTVAFVE